MNTPATALLGACLLLCAPAHAALECELNGERVSTYNGNTTAGKSGIMRCKDSDTGLLRREQELRKGEFVGVERQYVNGKLERESSVNERGNQHGRAREFAADGQVLSDSTYDNGSQTGLARTFHASGRLKRVTFYGAEAPGMSPSELAMAEFNEAGQLMRLRCTDKPVLAPAADDARWCGFTGGASQVSFFSGKGQPSARSTYLAGQRTRHEALNDNGTLAYQDESSAGVRTERYFSNTGVRRRELVLRLDSKRPLKEIEQDFSDTGVLTRDRRWAGGKPVSDQLYYLNGQPKSKTEFGGDGDNPWLQMTDYYDSGKVAGTGRYSASNRFRQMPLGTHQRFSESGRVVAESVYDDKGRITREKSWDEEGQLLRDDAVFEDGSRKAFAR